MITYTKLETTDGCFECFSISYQKKLIKSFRHHQSTFLTTWAYEASNV